MTEAKPESELLSIVHNGQTFREGDLVSFKPADHINTDWVTATLLRRDRSLASDKPWRTRGGREPRLLDPSGLLAPGVEKIIRIVESCGDIYAKGTEVTAHDGRAYRAVPGVQVWDDLPPRDAQGIPSEFFRVDFDATRDSKPEPAEEEPLMMGELQLADLETMAVGTVVRDLDGDLWTLGQDGWSNSEFRNIKLSEYDFAPYSLVSGGPIEGFVKAGTELSPEEIKVGMKLKIESVSAGDGYEESNSYTLTAHSETWGEGWVRVVAVNKSGETLGLSGWTITLLEGFAPEAQEEEPHAVAPESDVEPDMKAVLEEVQQSIDKLLNLLRSGGGEL